MSSLAAVVAHTYGTFPGSPLLVLLANSFAPLQVPFGIHRLVQESLSADRAIRDGVEGDMPLDACRPVPFTEIIAGPATHRLLAELVSQVGPCSP